jgi:tRNA-splicing ligase RtcB
MFPNVRKRGREQVGSLEAGNHFIEVDIVDEIFDAGAANVMGLYKGCLTVQIIVGARGLGRRSALIMFNSFRLRCENMN